MSGERATAHICVDTIEEANDAWYELTDTLAFLTAIAGVKSNEKGLRYAGDSPSLSFDDEGYGEVYVRAAALARCCALANAIGPDHVVWMHGQSGKTKKKARGVSVSAQTLNQHGPCAIEAGAMLVQRRIPSDESSAR